MTATTKGRPRKLPDSYFDLVRQFPLTCIRDDRHLADATAVVDRLLQTRLDRGGDEYLAVLSELIEAYEDEHFPMMDLTPAEVLSGLMDEQSLTQTALAAKTGIAQSTLSAVLKGTRRLTVEQISLLGKSLSIDPRMFLPSSR